MPVTPETTKIYHITDIDNLAGIVAAGGLFSDAQVRAENHNVAEIGYAHIKQRRLNEYTIQCCNGRTVGEFVPFYFCPRSPMLFTINKGGTGRPAGCQTNIVHLVSTMYQAAVLKQPWAISDGNAGASYTNFSNDNNALQRVNWDIVNSNAWSGERLHIKMTEFVIADFSRLHRLSKSDAIARRLPYKLNKSWLHSSLHLGYMLRHIGIFKYARINHRKSTNSSSRSTGQYREHRGCDG